MGRSIWLLAATALLCLAGCGRSDPLTDNIMAATSNLSDDNQANSADARSAGDDEDDQNGDNAENELNAEMQESADESVGIAAAQGFFDGSPDPDGGRASASSQPH